MEKFKAPVIEDIKISPNLENYLYQNGIFIYIILQNCTILFYFILIFILVYFNYFILYIPY